MTPRRAADGGFTLIEILVVLAITGLLIAAVPMALSGTLRHHRLAGAADQVAALLRQAHLRAIATGRATAFVGDVAGRRVALAGGPWTVLPEPVRLEIETTTDDVPATAIGRIRFFPDGSATGGAVALIDADERYVVRVDWFTGLAASPVRIAARTR